MMENPSELTASPSRAARLLAIEVLLTDPEALGDDVLESCLYILRDRLQGAGRGETSGEADARGEQG
jgi:hypothetical protein